MAEVLIKANLQEGDVIFVGFSSTKDEIKIKINKPKSCRDLLSDEETLE